MKRLFLSLVLASAIFGVYAADNDSLSGKWQIHQSAAGKESDPTCTFAQKDNDLTGSCSTERGIVQIAGKVDGKNVTWTYKSQYENSPLTVTYKGTLVSTAKITGTVVAEEFAMEGQFTANRSE
jgi:hypothetical protein